MADAMVGLVEARRTQIVKRLSSSSLFLISDADDGDEGGGPMHGMKKRRNKSLTSLEVFSKDAPSNNSKSKSPIRKSRTLNVRRKPLVAPLPNRSSSRNSTSSLKDQLENFGKVDVAEKSADNKNATFSSLLRSSTTGNMSSERKLASRTLDLSNPLYTEKDNDRAPRRNNRTKGQQSTLAPLPNRSGGRNSSSSLKDLIQRSTSENENGESRSSNKNATFSVLKRSNTTGNNRASLVAKFTTDEAASRASLWAKLAHDKSSSDNNTDGSISIPKKSDLVKGRQQELKRQFSGMDWIELAMEVKQEKEAEAKNIVKSGLSVKERSHSLMGLSSHSVHETDVNISAKRLLQQRQEVPVVATISEPTGSAQDFTSGRKNETFENVYTLGRMLGEGAFGEVFACTHKMSGTERAVKIIQKAHMTKWEYDDVIKEFQFLTAIDNPNVIRVYEFYDTPDTFYIVQELAQGGELYEELAKHGKLAEQDVAKLMKRILACVQYLADSNIVHRDINLENVLLEQAGNYEKLKLIDFGLAAKVSGEERLTEIAGKARYLAPEVLGDHGYGLKYDVWSCGIIAFVLLTGKFPFEADSDHDIYNQIVDGYVCSDNEPVWGETSAQAKAFIAKLLDGDEGTRPTAKEALNHPWLSPDSNVPAVAQAYLAAANVWVAPVRHTNPRGNDATSAIREGLVIRRRSEVAQRLSIQDICVAPKRIPSNLADLSDSMHSLSSLAELLSDSETDDDDEHITAEEGVNQEDDAARTIQKFMQQTATIFISYRRDMSQLKMNLRDVERRRQEELKDTMIFLELQKQQIFLQIQQEKCDDCNSHEGGEETESMKACRVHRQRIDYHKDSIAEEVKQRRRLVANIQVQKEANNKVSKEFLNMASKFNHLKAQLKTVERQMEPWEDLERKYRVSIETAQNKVDRAKAKAESLKLQCRGISRCIRNIIKATNDKAATLVGNALEEAEQTCKATVEALVGARWLEKEAATNGLFLSAYTDKRDSVGEIKGHNTPTSSRKPATNTDIDISADEWQNIKKDIKRRRSRSKSLVRCGSAPNLNILDSKEKETKAASNEDIDISADEWKNIKKDIRRRRSRSRSLRGHGSAPNLSLLDSEDDEDDELESDKIALNENKDIEKYDWKKHKKVIKKQKSRAKRMKSTGSAPDLMNFPTEVEKDTVRRVKSSSSSGQLLAAKGSSSKKEKSKKGIRKVKSTSTSRKLMEAVGSAAGE